MSTPRPSLTAAGRVEGSFQPPTEKAMTRHVEIAELLDAVPVSPAPMTRAAKLKHWASLVRKSKYAVFLLHGVE